MEKIEVLSLTEQAGHRQLSQDAYLQLIQGCESEWIILADEQADPAALHELQQQSSMLESQKRGVAYLAAGRPRLFWGFHNLWSADPELLHSPALLARKEDLLKAYGGADLAGDTLTGVAYSLHKTGGLKFNRIVSTHFTPRTTEAGKWTLWKNYTWKLPFRYLLKGTFFRHLTDTAHGVQRDMVFRMLLILFACFTFLYMPYISRDYGVTGDEFVDHRHAGYVLDYFAKGDKAALNQPQTTLHLYGNAVQVVTAGVCRWFDLENCYDVRHFFGGLVGAVGILAVGLLGLRWGGGLCGLISILLMFFTPRYFGHSMNNLKDVPFAVGYILAIFYTVRVFDCFPLVRLRHLLGLVLGIALALGTRSGGLILYPMLLMYAGLYYIRYTGGLREFYRFKKHRKTVGEMLGVFFIAVMASYLLAILLWPFALVNPLKNVVYSLTQFTNYSIGLRTIFEGQQVMSNMLPWNYAPKYLCIGMPIVTLAGFFGYLLYAAFRKKEFSLISFFLLFAAIFPVFWVIYKNSNLYGGIRHLLFVMPPMVLLAARCWSQLLNILHGIFRPAVALLFVVLLSLPVVSMVRSHPNEYVYFNEIEGGLKGAYGDYETDYYFNSLKESCDWFRAHVLPGLPTDRKTLVVTQAIDPVKYYFRNDTNIKVGYSRYYEKYSRDWDYAIFGNVYISKEQLKEGHFPILGTLYTPTVEGYPMSFVAKRDSKKDLEGFRLYSQQKYEEAIPLFESYLSDHPDNEEVWSRLGRTYYMLNRYKEAEQAFQHALKLYPGLNEALYVSALLYVDTKQYDKSAFYSSQMLAANKYSVDALFLQALVKYKKGDFKQAVDNLNLILRLRRNYFQAYELAGDIIRDLGNYAQAAKHYENALKYSKNAIHLLKMADMLVRLKKYDQVEKLLEHVVEGKASDYPIYKIRCRMALQQGKLKEAADCITHFTQVTDDADVYMLQAQYHYQTGDLEQCRLMLDQALKLDERHVEALKLKKQIQHK